MQGVARVVAHGLGAGSLCVWPGRPRGVWERQPLLTDPTPCAFCFPSLVFQNLPSRSLAVATLTHVGAAYTIVMARRP